MSRREVAQLIAILKKKMARTTDYAQVGELGRMIAKYQAILNQ